MRHKLEKILGVIAYDILPLNLQNQIDYLVKIWSPNVPHLDKTLLQKYALNCLEEIDKSIPSKDKDMAGIPLLCHLIAEVYANKVQFCITTKNPPMDFTLKIPQMYQHFVKQRIRKITSTKEEINNIKLFHIWHALKHLFPTESFQ